MRALPMVTACVVLTISARVLADDASACLRTAVAGPDVATVYLKSLSHLTVAEQKVMFASMPSDLKAGVWRQKLTLFLATARLTAEQRAFIVDSMALLRAELYDEGGSNAELSRSVSSIKGNAIRLFGHDRAVALFAELGPTSPGTLL